VLVRSDLIAEELDSRLQGLCPVITIMDCKGISSFNKCVGKPNDESGIGLEFDDVLIYNFFSQSPASAEAWQFVSGLPEYKRERENQLIAHPLLCIELKMLYVAITRARRRCWIWDSGRVVDAMKVLFLSFCMVAS
jgi:hypothetical protein